MMAIDVIDSEPVQQTSFAQLKTLIVESGLLQRQPLYYALRVPLTLAMLVPAILLLFYFDNVWIQIFNAVYLGFAFTQIVFLGHDCGHRQVFTKPLWNDLLGAGGMPIIGVSYSWWCDTHNRHHSRPNQMSADPAIAFDVFAFGPNQIVRKHKLAQLLIRFQAYYFLPLTCFYPLSMRFNSIRHIVKQKPKHLWLEVILFLLHFPIYFWLVFSNLDFGTGILFVLINQSVFSLFLVSTFAPNHKGMVILEEDHELDYIHQQVITAQNVQSHPFADFWFGGLNHQIEHHLFPSMPRNNLKRARQIIEPFCRQHSIPYREGKAPLCYWEILKFMHQVGRLSKANTKSTVTKAEFYDSYSPGEIHS